MAAVLSGAGRPSGALPRGRRSRGDREFLPAALEILESPPSPIGLALIVAICSLFAVALLWSWIGRIDIVATAPGKIQPQGRVKTIQSVETGRVTMVAGINGARVKAGDVLFTLDTADALADQSAARVSYHSYTAEARRHASAIAGARDKVDPTIVWPADTPAALVTRENVVLTADLAQLRAGIVSLEAQLNQKAAERQRLEGTIEAQGSLVATLKERVDMRATLMSTGSGAKSGVLDARELYETQAASLAYQKGQRGENAAGTLVAQSEIDKAYETFIADNTQKLAEAERQADDAAQRLAKAANRLQHMTVLAPIAGMVQGSTITTVGQVVNTGEEVMRLVPEGMRLEVEAYLPNKDVAFISAGQEVVVKVESLPFTRYGTLKGTILRIASDAIPQPEADMAQTAPARSARDGSIGGGQHTHDLVFPVTIGLTADSIEADGHPVALLSGMAVSAEVKTGSRRIIDYLLSSVLEVSSTAMRER